MKNKITTGLASSVLTLLICVSSQAETVRWGPKGVPYSFRDRVTGDILSCAQGDLYYTIKGNRRRDVTLGCLCRDPFDGDFDAISGYALSGFNVETSYRFADIIPAEGSELVYDDDGVTHPAFAVIGVTDNGEEILILHDDSLHTGESAYDNGLVQHYPGGRGDWSGELSLSPSESFSDGDNESDSHASSGSNSEADSASASDSSSHSNADASNEFDASITGGTAAGGSVTSDINNDITINVYPEVSGSVSEAVSPADDMAEIADQEAAPPVADVSENSAAETPMAPVGGYELGGSSVASCALSYPARYDGGYEGGFLLGAALVVLIMARIVVKEVRHV